jgi:2-polyprenyl-3-methyl-5-hydroxy-6-metoxy-1,4-benzoquinol methylase
MANSETVTFSFGENWLNYLSATDQTQFAEAQVDLAKLLATDDLTGKTVLDIGCGSGIHSLAALKMGATAVTSIDLDHHSVMAAEQVRHLTPISPSLWHIAQGSILDSDFLNQLPQSDIVYSWGVLHHTGDMWTAVKNAAQCVTADGLFVIAIYNHHSSSPFWLKFKRAYNRSPRWLKFLLVQAIFLPRILARLLKGKPPLRDRRGMSVYYDAIDWAGGLPYEFASPSEIIEFCQKMGFSLERANYTQSTGCNEYVLRKVS